MKKLLALFVAAFVTFSLSMCSSPSDSDSEQQFESYRNGAWLVTAPDRAMYEGTNEEQSTLKTASIDSSEIDTVFINNNDDHLIEMTNQDDHQRFRLVFTDSTITGDNDIHLERILYESPNHPFSASAIGIYRDDMAVRIELNMIFNGDYQEEDEKFYMNVYKNRETSGILFVYAIEAEGMIQTYKDIR